MDNQNDIVKFLERCALENEWLPEEKFIILMFDPNSLAPEYVVNTYVLQKFRHLFEVEIGKGIEDADTIFERLIDFMIDIIVDDFIAHLDTRNRPQVAFHVNFKYPYNGRILSVETFL